MTQTYNPSSPADWTRTLTLTRFLLCCCIALAATPVAAADAALLQRLSEPPAIRIVQLAPDGQHIALVRRRGDSYLVSIGQPGSDTFRIIYSSNDAIDRLSWLNEHRLLLGASRAGRAAYLLALERDGRAVKKLTPDDIAADLSAGAAVIDLLGRDPLHILASSDLRLGWQPDVYRINVYTAERELLEQNPGRVFDWQTDRAGRVRARSEYHSHGRQLVYSHYWKPPRSIAWKPYFSYRQGAAGLTPLLFERDNRSMIVSTDLDAPRRGIYRFDPTSAQLLDLLASQPGTDLLGIQMTALRQQPALAAFDADLPGQLFLDDRWQQWDAQLQALLPGTHNRIVSMDATEQQLIVLAYSDRHPGSFYLYNTGSGELTLVGQRMADVDPQQMASTRVIRVPTRDGRELGGYFTPPRGVAGPWPLVMYVHGGPWQRDRWGFDPMVQALALQGIAVLQLNFRGSAGLGRELLMAGARQWGLAMQDDLADAARWAVRSDLATADGICIMGRSYGGYAALMGVLRDPDLFRCAVAHAAVTDIPAQIRAYAAAGNLRAVAEWQAMVGDPELDRRALEAVSPVHLAGQLERPVLLVHGTLDRRVRIGQSRAFITAAEDSAYPVQWLPLPGEGHELEQVDNRALLMQQSIGFLESQLLP